MKKYYFYFLLLLISACSSLTNFDNQYKTRYLNASSMETRKAIKAFCREEEIIIKNNDEHGGLVSGEFSRNSNIVKQLSRHNSGKINFLFSEIGTAKTKVVIEIRFENGKGSINPDEKQLIEAETKQLCSRIFERLENKLKMNDTD